MSNEIEDDDKEQAMVPADARVSFIRKNDLTKVLRKVEKSTDKAILFLESVMLNEDNDLKTRVTSAQYLIDKRVELSESIARDQLSRLVAESRLVLAMQATQQKRIKNVTEEGEEDEATPRYMPSVILDHSSLKEM